MSPERETELVRMATELICRVRDVDPERNKTWLLSLTPEDRWDLLFVLAAAASPDVSLSVQLGWVHALAVPDE